MRWNTILFDLDGTVTDPKVGITSAAAYALRTLGLGDHDPDTLTPFIGPPLHLIFPRYGAQSDEQIDRATDLFREYYARQGWAENIPYPGMAAFLAALRDAGLTLFIATSKPEPMAVRILEHFDLAQYFTAICGSQPGDRSSADKAAVIRAALGRASDPARAVMVGDRCYDVAGGHTAGLPVVGVLYGYGGRTELAEAGADAIAANLTELKDILLGS